VAPLWQISAPATGHGPAQCARGGCGAGVCGTQAPCTQWRRQQAAPKRASSAVRACCRSLGPGQGHSLQRAGVSQHPHIKKASSLDCTLAFDLMNCSSCCWTWSSGMLGRGQGRAGCASSMWEPTAVNKGGMLAECQDRTRNRVIAVTRARQGLQIRRRAILDQVPANKVCHNRVWPWCGMLTHTQASPSMYLSRSPSLLFTAHPHPPRPPSHVRALRAEQVAVHRAGGPRHVVLGGGQGMCKGWTSPWCPSQSVAWYHASSQPRRGTVSTWIHVLI
jgi:hypothetical protein